MIRIKSTFALSALALGMTLALHTNTAYALGESIVLGGQICQPTNNTVKGIKWGGQGISNNSDSDQQVICPIVNSKLFARIDATARVTNRSNSPRDFKCQFKISNGNGDPVSVRSLALNDLDPGVVGIFAFGNFPVLDNQSAAVICKLQPKTGVTSITVDLNG